MSYHKLKSSPILIYFFLSAGFVTTNAIVCPAAENKNWTYRRDLSNGPDFWKYNYPGCGGQLQSPINIISSEVVKAENPQILELKNFDKPISRVVIENYGHYFTITPQDEKIRYLVLDGHGYPLHAFHFHFGSNANKEASEHAIDGKKYPMEGHFLFSLPEGGFLQVSSIFEIGNEVNPALDNILSVSSTYEYEGDKFVGYIQRDNSNPRRQGKIFLDDILDFNCPYYRYIGSNATPPCAEGTTWLICKTHKFVTNSQLHRLNSINTVKKEQDEQNDCQMRNNGRSLQQSNSRKVYG